MSLKLIRMKKAAPSLLSKRGAASSAKKTLNSEQTALLEDKLEKAKGGDSRERNWASIFMQAGLAMNALAGTPGTAQAAGVGEAQYETQLQAAAFDAQQIDLTGNLRDQYETSEFVKQDFTSEDVRMSLEHFIEKGRAFSSTFGMGSQDLGLDQAVERLSGSGLRIELPSGVSHTIKSVHDLQALDTFHGLGQKPVVSPEIVRALTSLELGLEEGDGLIHEESTLVSEGTLSAYEAYQLLSNQAESSTGSTLKGAAVGAGVVVLGLGAVALGGSALVPGLLTAAGAAGGMTLAGGAAAVAVGAGVGAAVGNAVHQAQHPGELEIRHGLDRGLVVRNLDHVVETHAWLQDRAANPFTPDQQKKSLRYFSTETGLFHEGERISEERALELLSEGEEVSVPSSLPGHSDRLANLRHLQQLDTVRGLRTNPVMEEHVSTSLRFLESGPGAADGLYRAGNFDGESRMSAFEAADYLFKERKPVSVMLRGKEYDTPTLTHIQELNALMGDGKNTILSDNHFETLRMFDKGGALGTIDAFEALQELKAGGSLRVQSNGRRARSESLDDLYELRALEFDRENTILPDRHFNLLNHWEEAGSYRVDNDGEADHAYEALQAIQGERVFHIESSGRAAPAASFQDMTDLATFETPEAGFPNTVPADDYERLMYFQQTNEEQGRFSVQVGGREGRAYEGYRELRDGETFQVRAGDRWNTVGSSEDLQELDALQGRKVNDILPQAQYDLLVHLADEPTGEGFVGQNSYLNSYATLQRFQEGRTVDYQFTGGDFSERLSIPTQGLEALDKTNELRDNQAEYDRYAYSPQDLQRKLQREAGRLPELSENNLEYAQGELRDAENDLSRGRRDLSSAERDLRRAESDLDDAQADLRRANNMSDYVYYDVEVCTETECWIEEERETNSDKTRAVRSARSDVSSAESDIRRAESDMDSAESLMARARRDISQANHLIDEAETLIAGLEQFESLLNGLSDSNLSGRMTRIKQELQTMKGRSHISSLDQSIGRHEQLLKNQETRPARPQGWQRPERLVQY